MKSREMKKIITIFTVVLLVTGLTGCTWNNSEPESGKDYSFVSTIMGAAYTIDYKDPVTGVHYLIYTSADGCGVTPRYNADGTQMVTEE